MEQVSALNATRKTEESNWPRSLAMKLSMVIQILSKPTSLSAGHISKGNNLSIQPEYQMPETFSLLES